MNNGTVPHTFSFPACLPHLLQWNLFAPWKNYIEIGVQTKTGFTGNTNYFWFDIYFSVQADV